MTNDNKLHPLCLVVCSLEMAVAKIREPLSLINLVKDNPMLWDSRNDDYKLTDRKAAIWSEIASKLNVDAGKLSFSFN